VKTLGRQRMKIQEASGDFYDGRNSVPKFRGKLVEDEDLKTTEIG